MLQERTEKSLEVKDRMFFKENCEESEQIGMRVLESHVLFAVSTLCLTPFVCTTEKVTVTCPCLQNTQKANITSNRIKKGRERSLIETSHCLTNKQVVKY